MADKRRAQGSKSTDSEVPASLTDSTHAVAEGVSQEDPDLVTHAAPDHSGSQKLHSR
jgi:hypothetical protein